jgi:hypothetical protein
MVANGEERIGGRGRLLVLSVDYYEDTVFD